MSLQQVNLRHICQSFSIRPHSDLHLHPPQIPFSHLHLFHTESLRFPLPVPFVSTLYLHSILQLLLYGHYVLQNKRNDILRIV